MRIITGEWKGVRLAGGNFRDLRPLTDRIKESLFGILGDEVAGARVLDLYAGVGSFGLEALSRGAETVVFVERARPVAALLRKNLAKVRCDPGRYRILTLDVWQALTLLSEESEPFDIVFADPPFRKKVGAKMLEALSPVEITAPGTLVVLRHHKEENLPEEVPPFRLEREKRYGDSVVKFYRREGK